ncbi:MAG: hypothetical protein M3347_18300 [Armatimonadota bacterium]|nr:hypothetical protein [Armatimonadota bacterium]
MKITTAMQRTALALLHKHNADLSEPWSYLLLQLDGVQFLCIERYSEEYIAVGFGTLVGDYVVTDQNIVYDTRFGPWLATEVSEPLERGGPQEAPLELSANFALGDPRALLFSARLARDIHEQGWLTKATISHRRREYVPGIRTL